MGLSEITKFAERGMVWVAQNYVVMHFDFKKLSGAYEVACHLNVSFGWRSLSAWVVVGEYHGGGYSEGEQRSIHTRR